MSNERATCPSRFMRPWFILCLTAALMVGPFGTPALRSAEAVMSGETRQQIQAIIDAMSKTVESPGIRGTATTIRKSGNAEISLRKEFRSIGGWSRSDWELPIPYKPRRIWFRTQDESVFYNAHDQCVYVTARKGEHDLSQHLGSDFHPATFRFGILAIPIHVYLANQLRGNSEAVVKSIDGGRVRIELAAPIGAGRTRSVIVVNPALDHAVEFLEMEVIDLQRHGDHYLFNYRATYETKQGVTFPISVESVERSVGAPLSDGTPTSILQQTSVKVERWNLTKDLTKKDFAVENLPVPAGTEVRDSIRNIVYVLGGHPPASAGATHATKMSAGSKEPTEAPVPSPDPTASKSTRRAPSGGPSLWALLAIVPTVALLRLGSWWIKKKRQGKAPRKAARWSRTTSR